MRARLVAVLLAGCGFEVGAGIDAARQPDAAIDAAIDAPPDAPGPPIMLVQRAANYVTAALSVDCVFTLAQTAGNANIIVVSWFASTGEVLGISDSAGNSYTSTNITIAGTYSMRIYYAPRIVASPGGNRISAQLSAALSFPKLRIFEYSGLAPAPFERGASSSGNSSLASSGTITTTTPHVLLFAANVINGISTPIAPFLEQDSSDGDLVEALEVQIPDAYTATANVNQVGSWVMMIAAFRGR